MVSRDSLTDGNLQDTLDVWKRKCKRIPVKINTFLNYIALHCCIIRKYGSTSYVGMGQVQNGVLYLMYRSDLAIMKAECCKAFIHEYSLLFYCRKCSQASTSVSQGCKNRL